MRFEKLRKIFNLRPSWSEEEIQAVWEKAKRIEGKDPLTYRLDSEGNEILRELYGVKKNKGWEIDHIFPRSRGGSDELENLQPLQWKANLDKSDSIK